MFLCYSERNDLRPLPTAHGRNHNQWDRPTRKLTRADGNVFSESPRPFNIDSMVTSPRPGPQPRPQPWADIRLITDNPVPTGVNRLIMASPQIISCGLKARSASKQSDEPNKCGTPSLYLRLRPLPIFPSPDPLDSLDRSLARPREVTHRRRTYRSAD